MSRGEHFARPSVHCAINFGYKALPAREVGRSSLDANPTLELLTHMHPWTRDGIDVCVVPLAESTLRPCLD